MTTRLDALRLLTDAIYEHKTAGREVPCVDPRRAHWWLSESADLQDQARLECEVCPAQELCSAYVSRHPESAGVWGGLLPTHRRTLEVLR